MTPQGHATIGLRIAEKDYDFKLKENEFIQAFYNRPSDNNFRPALDKSYVDFKKWNKESGFLEAKVQIEKVYHRSVEVTVLIEETPPNENQSDEEPYRELLKKMGIGVFPDALFKLPDGTRAFTTRAHLPRLNALYQEPKIINIVPKIQEK